MHEQNIKWACIYLCIVPGLIAEVFCEEQLPGNPVLRMTQAYIVSGLLQTGSPPTYQLYSLYDRDKLRNVLSTL
jgi:hypothetical protein